MKITKTQLKDLIREEIQNLSLKESEEENKNKNIEDFNFSKKELEFLQQLINFTGLAAVPANDQNIGLFKIKYVKRLMKDNANKIPSKWKAEYKRINSLI